MALTAWTIEHDVRRRFAIVEVLAANVSMRRHFVDDTGRYELLKVSIYRNSINLTVQFRSKLFDQLSLRAGLCTSVLKK